MERERGERRREIPTARGHRGLTQGPRMPWTRWDPCCRPALPALTSLPATPHPRARLHTQLGSSFRLRFLSSSAVLPRGSPRPMCDPSPAGRGVCRRV